MIGAPQWNSNFDPFTDWTYDDNMMYSCHRYGGDACVEAIGNFIAFRDKTNLPMYMGEIGHNTDEWQEAFCIAMEQSNIGITPPENWDKVMEFSEAPRTTYFEVRDARRLKVFQADLSEIVDYHVTERGESLALVCCCKSYHKCSRSASGSNSVE